MVVAGHFLALHYSGVKMKPSEGMEWPRALRGAVYGILSDGLMGWYQELMGEREMKS